MKEQHYKQVWIESEEDLPEDEGWYFVMTKKLDGFYTPFDDKIWWLNHVGYYLKPVEPKGLTDEEIEKKALELCPIIYLPDISIEGNENDDVNEYCREVVVDAIQWARDQMQGNQINYGICKEAGCKRLATKDYNGHGHWVCDEHFESLNNYFDEEYK